MSEPSRMELEPVTCWPLIIGAVGVVVLGVFSVMGFAVWSALFPPPRPVVAVVEAPRQTAPINREVVELPAAPVGRNDNERIVKIRREVVDHYVPLSRLPERAPGRPPTPPNASFRGPARSKALQEWDAPSRRTLIQQPADQLLRDLWTKAKDLDLKPEKGADTKQIAQREASEEKQSGTKDLADAKQFPLTKTIRDLLKRRSDLAGLPLQDEKDCLSSPSAAKMLAVTSLRVRRLQARRLERYPTYTQDVNSTKGRLLQMEGDLLLKDLIDQRKKEKDNPAVARPLEQMYQTESAYIRQELIETLAVVKGKEATQALTRRAVFDLSPSVRIRAVELLKSRRLDDARPILTAALRHPWPPAADHAAIALADLNDQKAVASLKDLVDQPDPRQPFQEDKKWFVRETVRVNHLRNCLLCHPVSTNVMDVVAAPVPTPGKPLPEVYYSRRRAKGEFVRADVVYFRQDFSVMHQVEKPNEWPDMQRFDYMVRTRELTAKEVAALEPSGAAGKTKDKTYPQREAVRYALKALQEKPVVDRAR